MLVLLVLAARGCPGFRTTSTFGKASYINPQDTRQYLFRLTPLEGQDIRQLK